MNQELANVIKIYSTKHHAELSTYLIGKSKDTLIGILVDLLTMYINDKNSSTIREFLTVTFAGYTHKEGKIGYNGFKQDAFVSGRTIKCEAKPKNFDTEEFAKYERGADFDYKDFIKCPNLKIVYLLNKDEIEKCKPYIVKDFYTFLKGRVKCP